MTRHLCLNLAMHESEIMKTKILVLLVVLLVSVVYCYSQTVTTSPLIPNPSQPVTISVDVSGTTFAGKNLSDVWLWAWLEKGVTDINAPTNVNPATTAQDAAK